VVHQFGGVKLSGLALHDVLGELEHVGGHLHVRNVAEVVMRQLRD
jgi:hypothetical protein